MAVFLSMASWNGAYPSIAAPLKRPSCLRKFIHTPTTCAKQKFFRDVPFTPFLLCLFLFPRSKSFSFGEDFAAVHASSWLKHTSASNFAWWFDNAWKVKFFNSSGVKVLSFSLGPHSFKKISRRFYQSFLFCFVLFVLLISCNNSSNSFLVIDFLGMSSHKEERFHLQTLLMIHLPSPCGYSTASLCRFL